jgi:phospholipid/cholesterol/gamma-HCH transport system substrate-binding protein
MERKANYTLVGFASLFMLIGLAIFVVWLGRFQVNRDFTYYDVVFVGSVTGLSKGGEVYFNGIKVGEVTEIELDKVDPNRVVARVRVGSDTPVREDSIATLEPQGFITGVSFIQITPGTPTKRLLKDITPPGQIPVIKSQPSALADLLAGGGTVLTRALEALDRINRVMSDKNIATFGATLDDVNVVTSTLKDQREVFADARSAIQSIDKAATDIAATAKSAQGLVDSDGKKALADIGKAADEIKAAAADARSVITDLKGPTTDFATNGLPRLQGAIVGLQATAESLERLINEVERSPQQLLSKEPAKEIEVAP